MGHKICQKCKATFKFYCPASSDRGAYCNLARHLNRCKFCISRDRTTEANKRQELRKKKYQAELQPPWRDWSQEPGRIYKETGIEGDVFDLVLRSLKGKLAAVHGRKTRGNRGPLLSEENLLLMYLCFMRGYDTEDDLAKTFSVSTHMVVHRYVQRIAPIVAECLSQYVSPPPRRPKRIIQNGPLGGVCFQVDTAPTPIPRPGKLRDRKSFFDGKRRAWSIKWQLTFGHDGRIWEAGPPPHAFCCSTSDKRIYEESCLPEFTTKHGIRGVGDSHYVKCTNMIGKRIRKRPTQEDRQLNRELESIRAAVENLNHRVKLWKVFKGPYRHSRRDMAFFGQMLISVCGLINLSLDKHPIRRDLKSLLPRIAIARQDRRGSLQRQNSNQSGSDTGSNASDSDTSTSNGSSADSEDDCMCPVEKLVGKRESAACGITYRVRWVGYGPSDDLWMPATHITQDLIDQFHSSVHASKKRQAR